MNIVETKKLTKYYGQSRGIIDVDLSIKGGEIFGFIGPNGAGKSTFIRTILGLLKPTDGSATIFGKDVTKFGPVINQEIGYLPSEVFYYDDMKVVDLLKYSASFYDKNLENMSNRINDLSEYLDLDLDKKIEDLSYGNKKKVGIVQCLLHEPKLIILDEPTGGLDPLMQQRFFELLEKENQKGATILFSSHVLSEVQKLCDRVAIIKDGKIIKTEKINNLVDKMHKKFKLETAVPIDKRRFSGLKGISNLSINGNNVSFLFRGKINDVTKILSSLNLTNILIEEPDLEEIFIHYYK